MNKMLFVSKEFSENLDSSVAPHLESDVFERSINQTTSTAHIPALSHQSGEEK